MLGIHHLAAIAPGYKNIQMENKDGYYAHYSRYIPTNACNQGDGDRSIDMNMQRYAKGLGKKVQEVRRDIQEMFK